MTIKDIAEMANVSPAAVSRYFNNGYISEEKRLAIQKAVEKTGFYPSGYARTLRTKKSFLIGVVIPRIASNSISKVVEGIMSVTEPAGYTILLANTMNNEMKELDYIKIFNEKQVDALMLFGTILTEEHNEALKNLKCPVVVIGQRVKDVSCVYHDDYQAVYEMTKLVLGKGRRRLCYIGAISEDISVGTERYRGYMQAAADSGLGDLAERNVTAGFDIDDGYKAMEELFKLYPDIDGVIAATDTMAVGAMRYLKEKGLRIPEDVMITGIGNSEYSEVISPALTTANYFYKESGILAAEMIIKSIKGDLSGNRETKMGYSIIENESTGFAGQN